MSVENEKVNEKERPFFSVIIPTFNRAHSILKSIDSVLVQTFSDFEIIVVDDSSNDNTVEVLSTIKDSRLKFVRNEKNEERCVTRNKGVELAHGKYICFLDSDDYHLPNHLESIYKKIFELKEPKAFFFVNAWDEDVLGNKTERCCPDFENYNPYTYFLHYTVNPQRWAVHHSIFEKIKFDPEVVICEDIDTSLRILASGYSIFQIKDRTTVYVSAVDSFTNSDKNKAEKELFYLKRIFSKKELIGKLPRKETNRLISMCYFHLLLKADKEKSRWKVHLSSIKSFFLCPKGYNGKTNKILLVINLYQLLVIGSVLKLFMKLIKHQPSTINH